LDCLIVIRSENEAACLARFQEEKSSTDVEFRQRMERWKAASPSYPPFLELFAQVPGFEPVIINAEDNNAKEVLERIAAHVEAKRPVRNFKVPTEHVEAGGGADGPAGEQALGQDELRDRSEAEEQKRKKDQERLEQIKREEFGRLEKHSEPLRQYLMALIVPTITSALIDICRETPADPVGYLAEYLSVYAQLLAYQRRRALVESRKKERSRSHWGSNSRGHGTSNAAKRHSADEEAE